VSAIELAATHISSARGLFLLKRGGAGPKPLICKEMAENKPFRCKYPVNKL
jgi:hypothetical protein